MSKVKKLKNISIKYKLIIKKLEIHNLSKSMINKK